MSIVMSRVASPRGPSRRPANRSIAAALVGVSLLSAPLACSSTSDFPATRSSTDAAQQTLAPDDDTSSGDAPTDSGSVPVADVDTSSVDTSSVDTSSVDTSSVDTESPATPDADTDLTIDPEPDLTPPNIVERSIEFPVVVSDDRNAILDSDGRPLLFTGDAAWSMIVQLDDDEAADYLQIRRDMGFDTLLVNLIEHQFSDDPPNNPDGVPPFGSPGDFTDPIPAYFDHAHDLIALARDFGFVVLLAPAYLGYEGGPEGWYQDMVVAGPDVLYEYGRFVGARFAGLDNIIWLDGGDYTPPNDDLDLVRAVRDGIVDAGATQLRTAHWSPETSAADVDVDWLDFNTTYTYGPVYLKSSSDEQVPSLPHIVLESQYEQDIWDNTSQRVRSQIYEAVLTGAAGSIYGHGDVWQYTSGWRDALDEPGAVAMTRARQLFDSLPWSDLVPDVRANAVVANIGEFGDERVVVAAATPDRTTVVAYVPDERDVDVDLTGVSGHVSVTWFDPTAGTLGAAEASVADDDGTVSVRHPGDNADGDRDWVLVLRTA